MRRATSIVFLLALLPGRARETLPAPPAGPSEYLGIMPAPPPVREFGYAIQPKSTRIAADATLQLIPSRLSNSSALQSLQLAFPPGGRIPFGSPISSRVSDVLAGDTAYPVEIRRIATWTVGLCELTATMENGDLAVFWLNIEGRSPFATVLGVAALIIGCLGIVVTVLIARREFEENKLYLALLPAGALFGTASNLLLQQYGVVRFGWPPLIVLGVCGWMFGWVLEYAFESCFAALRESASAKIKSQLDTVTRSTPSSSGEEPDPGEGTSRARFLRSRSPLHVSQVLQGSTPVLPPPTTVDPAEDNRDRESPGFWRSLAALFPLRISSPILPEMNFPPISHVAQQATVATVRVEIGMSCPELVAAGQEFTLVVSVPTSVTNTAGARRSTPCQLTVQLVASGFQTRPGETWRRQVETGGIALLPPSAEYHLTPKNVRASVPAEARTVQTVFSSSGEVLGATERVVGVVANEEILRQYGRGSDAARRPEIQAIADVHQAVQARSRQQPTFCPIDIPGTSGRTADITVWLRQSGADAIGNWAWALQTPLRGMTLPDQPPERCIGSEARSFARAIVDQVSSQESKPFRMNYLLGLGKTISQHVPDEFWALLRQVQAYTKRPPTVLILTEEPNIPWELALLPPPLLDDQAPGFLAAQAVVGRWLVNRGDFKNPLSAATADEPGGSSPTPPGTTNLPLASNSSATTSALLKKPLALKTEVKKPVFVTGTYTHKIALKHAEQEVADLVSSFGGEFVKATQSNVMRRLADGSSDLFHFACHGTYDPLSYDDGLSMIDGSTLHPLHVAGQSLAAPFVFLNACQVGSGAEVLGTHGGMVSAFLLAGAAAVVAPLWSIRDEVSSQVARQFYEEVAKGGTPADVLRRLRREFRKSTLDGSDPSLTHVAFVFFGHPNYQLVIHKQPPPKTPDGLEPNVATGVGGVISPWTTRPSEAPPRHDGSAGQMPDHETEKGSP